MTSIGLFFFNDTATTEIYTLSLHDALPIFQPDRTDQGKDDHPRSSVRTRGLLNAYEGAIHAPKESLYVQKESLYVEQDYADRFQSQDRKSTRLNSSHGYISYAVFCLKKKDTLALTYTS